MSKYNFVQKSGPRKGQHFYVTRGESGQNVRVYRPDPVSGTRDTALTGNTPTARTPATVNPREIGRTKLTARVAAKRKPPKITEDDPRWVQMLAHGQGQEHKIGADITVPRRYVGQRRG